MAYFHNLLNPTPVMLQRLAVLAPLPQPRDS
jgi:hypothetical protein